MRFKNLEKARIGPQSVSRIYFPEIEGPPVDATQPDVERRVPWLEVRPAAECNRAFFDALLKSQAKSAQEILKDSMDTADLAKDREASFQLYAQFVLTGNGGAWLDDESGEEVTMPLSLDARLALCKQLPSHLYDRLRRHAINLANFRS